VPLAIAYLPLGELKGAEKNPKRHDLPTLRRSIERFGYAEAVVRDERTGRLVAGHGRVAALRELHEAGGEPPEGVVDDGLDWLVPVQTGWSSKDDAEAGAFLVAANRLTETGGWDELSLVELLDEVAKTSTESLQGVGYDEADLARLRGPGGDAGAQAPQEPDPTRTWRVLRFKVPPELRARYVALTERWHDQDDARQFERLVAAAEKLDGK
jgi:hypothetical protein